MTSLATALAPRGGARTAPSPSPGADSRRRRLPVLAASARDAAEEARGDDARRSRASTSSPGASSRRGVLASTLSLSALSLSAPALSLAATMPDSEPTGLDANGRLRKCPSTFNCVSTSSTGGAPEQYGSAWTASTATVEDASRQITAAVFRACPDARGPLDEAVTASGARYLRFAMPGKLGEDVVEILIKNESVGDLARDWEGDVGREREWLVTYRSLATTVKYVYPFMTPVGDFGEQRKRMERIRKEVGWRRVGCELEDVCENDLEF
jgi:uncharacterized protein (DUF1499 family)